LAGLTLKCRAGDTFQIGDATVLVVKTGRKTTVNVVAPSDVKITYSAARHEIDAQSENVVRHSGKQL